MVIEMMFRVAVIMGSLSPLSPDRSSLQLYKRQALLKWPLFGRPDRPKAGQPRRMD